MASFLNSYHSNDREQVIVEGTLLVVITLLLIGGMVFLGIASDMRGEGVVVTGDSVFIPGVSGGAPIPSEDVARTHVRDPDEFWRKDGVKIAGATVMLLGIIFASFFVENRSRRTK